MLKTLCAQGLSIAVCLQLEGFKEAHELITAFGFSHPDVSLAVEDFWGCPDLWAMHGWEVILN